MSATVTVLNAKNNTIITEIQVGETPHSAALSPDGSRLAVTSFDGNVVFLINTATDKMVAQIPVGRNPLDIAYSPDGRYLFTANNEDNTVTVIDTADNRVIAEIPTGKSSNEHLGAAQRAPGIRHRRGRRHHRNPEHSEVRAAMIELALRAGPGPAAGTHRCHYLARYGRAPGTAADPRGHLAA